MDGLKRIEALFPELTVRQRTQLEALKPLYTDWNRRINVISRNDVEHLYLRHVLHSLAIARYAPFAPGAAVLDLGTGGGFPGIPLAIRFPDARFTLVDARRKKITVVQAIADALRLKNVTPIQAQAETLPGRFDTVVCRAVAPLTTLAGWVREIINHDDPDNPAAGLIALKGGAVADEISALLMQRRLAHEAVDATPVSRWFPDPFFAEKYIVHCRF
ncbi:MAG: 16S rRNA (guanine(527)-N(7))-methyltransferase RsmG [Prevotellaceae bacterium]|jgi:16S rRNA (guanine527-N7)-methyltransferase|nr:16S rRNA (guanine(527)-N(7))-methyltransferase RsmG [Prevotellaceae bacterium]